MVVLIIRIGILTAEEIKQKLALPNTPTFISTVTVPAGTNNQEFRANIIVDGDYVVKDADDTEIAEESDAILKEGTKVVLGNDAVYTVVLDFSTPFITTTKYELSFQIE